MDRRVFLGSAAALAVTGAVAPLRAQAATPEDARLRALLDAFFEADLDESPESATIFGLDVGKRAGQRSQLGDLSFAGRTRWVAARKARLAQLSRIDAAKLSAASRTDLDVVTYAYRTIVEGGERFPYGEGAAGFSYAPYSPYVLSQLSGAYQSIPDFLDSVHPVKNASDAEAYLARLNAFAGVLDANTGDFQRDAARGVLAPDFALDATLAQLKKLREPAAEAHGLTTSLSRRAAEAKIAGDWKARAAALVSGKVYPALDRQIAAVTAARPQAKPDPGVWKLPDGEAFYAGALAFQTTTKLTPDQAHELGLRQVAELEAQMDALLRAEGLIAGTVGERMTQLSKRPDQLYPNTDAGRAELLKALNEQTEAMRAKMPLAFRTLPKAPVEIVRVPPEIQDGAPNGYATPPALDGSRAGRFYINLKDTAEWPKFTLPTLTYHEALPGHQWEGSISLASTEIPRLRQVSLGFAAYGEGWGLYAEQLADELGAYEGDPLGKLGFLQSLQFRAVRVVVDTGMHAKRWSRAQATDYMVAKTGFVRTRAQREIDRYAIWPGQACSYKIGHTEWVRLRDEAKARAGSRFDLKTFHDVLRRGAMPLVVLEQVVQETFPARA
ncbi:DUF885 family protein [Phenylobacterium sp. J426]|uniref:DUF885 domain-containing protein n=1 Tax=Phenylobacterium sp. J426 TaxID=2898439 RepID=UPI0021511E35|nr:DUF885 family protein [Phenylobacterium sp. J426]MCR5872764.1 DUF885 family protein [Phenylobacterium sp. J426]